MELLPRLLCSFFAGAILSQTGSFIQLGSRNILASPSTLGFDGVAVFWILIVHSCALMFGMELGTLVQFFLGLPIFILLGYLFPSKIYLGGKQEKLILIGLTFNLLVGALFSLWQFLFVAFNLPFPVELWFGHFRYASWAQVLVLVVAEVALLVGLKKFLRDIQIFSLGSTLSKNLRLNEKSLYRYLFISVAIGTAAVVTIFGAFSFLALVFPILARKIWFKNRDLSGEILLGSFVNGLLLMGLDFLCYQYPVWGAEIPVGLVVTAVGAVSLIALLWSRERSEILVKPNK